MRGIVSLNGGRRAVSRAKRHLFMNAPSLFMHIYLAALRGGALTGERGERARSLVINLINWRYRAARERVLTRHDVKLTGTFGGKMHARASERAIDRAGSALFPFVKN